MHMHDKKWDSRAAIGTSHWTEEDIPSQVGRLAVVTGADSGLGLEVTKGLVRHGCAVVMAGNAVERARKVSVRLRAETPGTTISVEPVDLGDLASVRDFAARFHDHHGTLDLLVNNAGIMFPPLMMTKDGFEGHFGINYLGHFALTGLLLDRILATPQSRVVTVASNSHKMGHIDFGNFQAEKGYHRMRAYAQSKLANLLFSAALARRFGAARADTLAVAAHPGQSATRSGGQFRWPKLFERVISQSVERGALPILRATTDPGARQDDYYGPDGFLQMRGAPRLVDRSPRARDQELGERLWSVSESLSGVHYRFTVPTETPEKDTDAQDR